MMSNTASTPLKIGFLGAGRVAARYVDVFKNEGIEGAEVTAVCDLVSSKAESVASQLEAQAFTSFDDMIERADVDLVIVMTESGKHHDHVQSCLKAKKHVIVEKPAAIFPEQVLASAKAFKEAGLMYAPIFQNRFNPAVRAVKAALDENRFGKIVSASIRLHWCRFQDYYEDGWHGTWEMDGGVSAQQAIHHIDVVQWLAGPVESLVSNASRRINEPEAEDFMMALLKFKNTARGTLELTTACRDKDREASVTISGEKGYVKIGGIALNEIHVWDFIESRPEDESASKNFSQWVPTGYGLSHGPLIQEVFSRVTSGSIEAPITGEDAVEAVKLVHALYKSHEEGAWVKLDDKPLSKLWGAARESQIRSAV